MRQTRLHTFTSRGGRPGRSGRKPSGAGADPFTSQVAVIAPETFLMRRLC